MDDRDHKEIETFTFTVTIYQADFIYISHYSHLT